MGSLNGPGICFLCAERVSSLPDAVAFLAHCEVSKGRLRAGKYVRGSSLCLANIFKRPSLLVEFSLFIELF